jgi:hypothetical protein
MKDIYALYVDCSYGFYVIPDDDIMIDHMRRDASGGYWAGGGDWRLLWHQVENQGFKFELYSVDRSRAKFILELFDFSLTSGRAGMFVIDQETYELMLITLKNVDNIMGL